MSADVTREAVLRAYDLALLAPAAKYDLDNRVHRKQSARELVRLFFGLTRGAEIDLFIEAGAKEASASRRARAALPAARVVAFEANPYTHRRFAAVNEAAGVEYLHRALTGESGPVTFNVLRNAQGDPIGNGQASLLKRHRVGDAERGFAEVTVDGIPLDEFFAGHEFARAAMWVDVEGACGIVLPGARDVLARTSVLIVEVEDRNDWGPDHWLREQVVGYLFDLGLVPVARDFEYATQFNIVFVRDTLLCDATVRRLLTRFASRAYGPRPDPTLAQRVRNAAVHRIRSRARRVTSRSIKPKGATRN